MSVVMVNDVLLGRPLKALSDTAVNSRRVKKTRHEFHAESFTRGVFFMLEACNVVSLARRCATRGLLLLQNCLQLLHIYFSMH